MLFVGSSEVIGETSRSRLACALRSAILAPLLANRLSTHSTTIIFKPAAKIHHTAGGTYGDESYTDRE